MKKEDILKNYQINKIGKNTVFIENQYFSFSYTKADSVVKDEFVGMYKYFGGLQSPFHEDSEDYKNLEKWLVDIADKILN